MTVEKHTWCYLYCSILVAQVATVNDTSFPCHVSTVIVSKTESVIYLVFIQIMNETSNITVIPL